MASVPRRSTWPLPAPSMATSGFHAYAPEESEREKVTAAGDDRPGDEEDRSLPHFDEGEREHGDRDHAAAREKTVHCALRSGRRARSHRTSRRAASHAAVRGARDGAPRSSAANRARSSPSSTSYHSSVSATHSSSARARPRSARSALPVPIPPPAKSPRCGRVAPTKE